MTAQVFRSKAAAEKVIRKYREVLELWPVPRTELVVPTRQGETFVVACGPEDAPPVVLLHGSQANAAAWMFDAALWSRSFRLYSVDMIGEAGLSAAERPALSDDSHALWLDDVLRGLGVSAAAFVGTSLGGWLALDYASRRPGIVERLTLICPAGIGRQKNFLLKAAPLLLFGSWGKRRMRQLVFGPTPADRPAAARPFVELMELVGRSIKPRVVTIPRLSDDQLRQLTMPMLVIVGGRDVLLDSVDTRDRLARLAPHADVRYLDDGYHFLPGHAAAVLQFLEQISHASG